MNGIAKGNQTNLFFGAKFCTKIENKNGKGNFFGNKSFEIFFAPFPFTSWEGGIFGTSFFYVLDRF